MAEKDPPNPLDPKELARELAGITQSMSREARKSRAYMRDVAKDLAELADKRKKAAAAANEELKDMSKFAKNLDITFETMRKNFSRNKPPSLKSLARSVTPSLPNLREQPPALPPNKNSFAFSAAPASAKSLEELAGVPMHSQQANKLMQRGPKSKKGYDFTQGMEGPARFLPQLQKINKEAADFSKYSSKLKKDGTFELTPVKKQFFQAMADGTKKFRENLKDAHVDQFDKQLEKIQKRFEDIQKKQDEGKGSKTLLAIGGAAAITTGIAVLDSVLGGLKTVIFSTWDYIDQFVLPTTANLGKTLGNTGGAVAKLSSQAMGAGETFRRMGLDFGAGAQAVMQIAASMSTIAIPDTALRSALKLSEYVGLGAEQTGQLMNAFLKTGGSLKVLDGEMRNAINLQTEFGVPVQQIRRDIGENIDLLHRFGTANVGEFQRSAAAARSYGLDIKQVDAAFGRQLDTIEGTTNVASKLNAAFGTTINSMELLLEQSPEKRFEMIREALERTGKSFNTLSVSEQNVLMETTNLDRKQAALAFSSGKARKEALAQVKAQERSLKVTQDWDRGLGNLRSVLVNTQAEFQILFRAIGEVAAKWLGFNSATEMASKGADIFKSTIEGLANRITEFAGNMEKGDGLNSLFEKVLKTVNSVTNSLDSMAEAMENITDWSDSPNARNLVTQFQELQKGASSEALQNFANNLEGEDSDVKELFFRKLARAGTDKEEADTILQNYKKGMSGPMNFGNSNVPANLFSTITIEMDSEVVAKKVAKQQVKSSGR